MDEIDRIIISELMKDARVPFNKIAKKLGVSIPTISKRYDKLKKKKIIEGSSIKLDLSKLGYKGTAHLLFTNIGTNSSQIENEFMKELIKINGIIIASTALGDYEGYAVLAFKNIEELFNKLLKIRSLCCVTDTEMSIGIPGIHRFPPNRNPFNITAL